MAAFTTILQRRTGTKPHPKPNVSLGGRIAYCAVSLLSMIVICILFGIRIKHLRFNNIRQMNAIRSLIIAVYIDGMALVFSLAMMSGGIGLTKLIACQVSVMICLIFYVGQKVLMYLFLVERAHVLRTNKFKRTEDWVWVIGVLIVVCGFGSIVAVAFIYPSFSISRVDGKCRIGAPQVVTIPLLAYDILINVALTALFIVLLWPSIKFRSDIANANPSYWFAKYNCIRDCTKVSNSAKTASVTPKDPTPGSRQRVPTVTVMEKLIKKSFYGALLVLIPTIVNLALLYHLHGKEQAWLCFTLCTVDVTWAICVVHWMTVDPLEVDAKPRPACVNEMNINAL